MHFSTILALTTAALLALAPSGCGPEDDDEGRGDGQREQAIGQPTAGVGNGLGTLPGGNGGVTSPAGPGDGLGSRTPGDPATGVVGADGDPSRTGLGRSPDREPEGDEGEGEGEIDCKGGCTLAIKCGFEDDEQAECERQCQALLNDPEFGPVFEPFVRCAAGASSCGALQGCTALLPANVEVEVEPTHEG